MKTGRSGYYTSFTQMRRTLSSEGFDEPRKVSSTLQNLGAESAIQPIGIPVRFEEVSHCVAARLCHGKAEAGLWIDQYTFKALPISSKWRWIMRETSFGYSEKLRINLPHILVSWPIENL